MKPLKRALKVLLLTVAAYLVQVCVMRYFAVRSVVGSVIFAVLAVIVVTCGKKYAFCASCTYNRMQLINKKQHISSFCHFADYFLDAFLELATILGLCDHT